MLRNILLINTLLLILVTNCWASVKPVVLRRKIHALHQQAPKLSPKVLKLALIAYYNARRRGYDKKQILTVIDYSQPSTRKRLWVFNLKRNKLNFHALVAHGKNSGYIRAKHFSNRSNSLETSLGLYLTGHTYYGHNGYSLKMIGLEKGFNSNAYKRHVVMHGAKYVSRYYIKALGYLGRSWGCPALSKKIVKPVINEIKNGTLVFAYYPLMNWINHSKFLHT